MTITRIIGDIHGKFEEYSNNILSNVHNSIQIGDFGIGFYGDYWHEKVKNYQLLNPDNKFIRGNHDDPEKSKKMPGYIPDGFVENDVMFIGGAWSIDYEYRTEGVSWWKDEECSYEEFEKIIDIYKIVKPRILFCHDAPIEVSDAMFIKKGLALGGSNARQIRNRTNMALQVMIDYHKPEFMFFGHWHVTSFYNYMGTSCVCLGELDYIDVDLNDSDQINQAIINKFS